jgi:crotonobetainyl-CoA:carnitine CoA-transferase CaiB-like acyl-CoA transferase
MQSYRSRDGQILLLMALERKFFVRLAAAVERPDLVDLVAADQYLVRGNPEIDAILGEVIASKDLEEWMAIFSAADVPVVPVYRDAEALDDIHLRTRFEWLPAAQGTVTMKAPVHSAPRIADPAPAAGIGQHTAEVLSGVGVTDAEIEHLAAEGVIRLAERDG